MTSHSLLSWQAAEVSEWAFFLASAVLLTLAAVSFGQPRENFECSWTETPGETVLLKGQMVCRQRGVGEPFNFSPLPSELDTEFFLGAPLLDAKGHAVGLLALLSEKPLANQDEAEDILALFALRAANELERRRAEEERVRLEAIVDSSEDAIIGKTLDGIIASWNRGAQQTCHH